MKTNCCGEREKIDAVMLFWYLLIGQKEKQ